VIERAGHKLPGSVGTCIYDPQQAGEQTKSTSPDGSASASRTLDWQRLGNLGGRNIHSGVVDLPQRRV